MTNVPDFLEGAVDLHVHSAPDLDVRRYNDIESVHIGIGVAVDDETLLALVLREAERKTLDQIAAESRTLVARARARQLTPDDIAGRTFTISNLGMYSVEHFTGVINPPQTAILAVGAIRDELRAVDHTVVSVPVTRLTLGVDHRVIDGAYAAKFLSRLKELLEHAGQLAGVAP